MAQAALHQRGHSDDGPHRRPLDHGKAASLLIGTTAARQGRAFPLSCPDDAISWHRGGMAARTANFCIDCHDPRTLATWWSNVLDDFVRTDDAAWEEDEAELVGPAGRCLEFLRVPEEKIVKNRMHICVRPVEGTTRDEELDRLLALGAAVYDDRREGADGGWVVLTDPEGNEFCLLTRTAEAAGVHRR